MDPLAIVVRPLALLVLLGMAWGLSRLLHRVIPPGKVRDFLYKRHEVIPSEASRRR